MHDASDPTAERWESPSAQGSPNSYSLRLQESERAIVELRGHVRELIADILSEVYTGDYTMALVYTHLLASMLKGMQRRAF